MNPPNREQAKERRNGKWVFLLPYIDRTSVDFCKRLKRLIPSSMKKCVNFVFRCTRLRGMFPMKWPTPKSLVSSVVYKFTCVGDQRISHIGETKRHLGTRLKEHTTKASPILDHFLSCDSCIPKDVLNNTKVLCRTKYVRIAEALLIKQKSPSLNETTGP